MDVYEVIIICKIVHLTVRTLSYVNRPTSGPLRPPSRSAELRTMPEVGRKCLESAHFRLTSGPALLRFTSVHFGSLRFTYGPLRPTSVPYPVGDRTVGVEHDAISHVRETLHEATARRAWLAAASPTSGHHERRQNGSGGDAQESPRCSTVNL